MDKIDRAVALALDIRRLEREVEERKRELHRHVVAFNNTDNIQFHARRFMAIQRELKTR